MSIEIRVIRIDGIRHFECDWGLLNNAEADPRHDLQHLVLTAADYVEKLLTEGPQPGPLGGVCSASTDGERTFIHLDYNSTRTTWEIFEAHFEDGGDPDNLLIGRWPD